MDEIIEEHLKGSKNINIDYIDYDSVTVEEFMERFEKPDIPCIIRGIQDSWVAKDKWTWR